MLRERDYSDEFLTYARSRQNNLTDKYLADLLEAMIESSNSMIKNKQLAVFNENSIPVYKQILRGRGYSIGEIVKTSSDTYIAPIFIKKYRKKQPVINLKSKRCKCK